MAYLDFVRHGRYALCMLLSNVEAYKACTLCPRRCRADRTAEKRGFCGESGVVQVALATRHFGEEPALVGDQGSGTVFFTGCTLRCSFCQNCQISRDGVGAAVDAETLANIFLALEDAGAANINLVTGTQFAPDIASAVQRARQKGLRLRIVWNSSGYENDEGLAIIESFTDVFLPDLKTLDEEASRRMFNARDYPQRATEAILKMAEKGQPVIDSDGMMQSGTVVRHLVLPGRINDTRKVLQWFGANLRDRALLSLMFQYLPPVAQSQNPVEPGRTIEDAEYYQVIGILEELELDDGWVQEPEYNSPWMPDFEAPNPFPDEFSKVVWNWRTGFVNR